MKKLCFLLLILATVGGTVFAADFDILSYPPPVKGGNILIDAGLGIRGTGYSNSKWRIPPLFVQVEYALPVQVPISVGGLFTIYSYGYNWSDGEKWTWTDFTIAARGNWHWGFDINWLDLYTGLSLGYTVSKWKSNWAHSSWGNNSGYGGFYFAGQVGAHFYFTKMIGAVVEVGYPYWIKGGIAFKF